MIDLLTFKLRAWDKKNNIMVYFQGNNDADNLSRLESENTLSISKNVVSVMLSIDGDRHYLVNDPSIPVDDFDLMMYSSVFDVDKQQICMGDVVQYESDDIKGGVGIFYIDMCNGDLAFQFLEHHKKRNEKHASAPFSRLSSFHSVFDKVKIIGNVYENPEFLDQKSIK